MTIVEPQVYLVGYQVIDDAALEKFLAAHHVEDWQTDTTVAGEALTEVSGRLCYMSFAKPRPGGNSAYLAHIKETGHGSVLEHAVYTLLVTGVDRAFTHELVRHRAGFAYSQLSQRYVDESVCEVVCPPALRHAVAAAKRFLSTANNLHIDAEYQAEDYDKWLAADEEDWKVNLSQEMRAGLVWLRNMARSNDDYAFLSAYLYEHDLPAVSQAHTADEKTAARKEARQAARSVLPNATETKVSVTVNARAARHFLEMRCSRFADAHMREVAGKVYEALVAHSPTMFGDYVKISLPDGSYELDTPHRKV